MWSKEEKEKLKELVAQKPFTWAEIAIKMKRTQASVQGKAHRMGLTKKKYYGSGVAQIYERWYGVLSNELFRYRYFPDLSLNQIKLKAFRLRKKGFKIRKFRKS